MSMTIALENPPVLQRTPLFEKHKDAGARMVDFGGWEMPINYGSQIAEHKAVRERSGLFDVSHMTITDVTGKEAEDYLRWLVTNDVIKLDVPGKALYTAMLNDQGGVIDDLIVYSMEEGYRLVTNCATRDKDLTWMKVQAEDFDVQLEEKPDLAILAVHGPEAIEQVCQLLSPADAQKVESLRNFEAVMLDGRFVARTGYTGEKGLELIIGPDEAMYFWDSLVAAGVQPVGLGARDSLRLEAGMNLYGHDMDEEVSPLSANMQTVITWEPEDRAFMGREALTHDRALFEAGELPCQKGIVLESKGVLREGQVLHTDKGTGVITSGGFSPTLNHSIGLARVPVGSTTCEVEMRGKKLPVRLVKPGFVRFGKKVFD